MSEMRCQRAGPGRAAGAGSEGGRSEGEDGAKGGELRLCTRCNQHEELEPPNHPYDAYLRTHIHAYMLACIHTCMTVDMLTNLLT
jgi:hypothetical protein